MEGKIEMVGKRKESPHLCNKNRYGGSKWKESWGARHSMMAKEQKLGKKQKRNTKRRLKETESCGEWILCSNCPDCNRDCGECMGCIQNFTQIVVESYSIKTPELAKITPAATLRLEYKTLCLEYKKTCAGCKNCKCGKSR